ncbi:TetR family transcriptional regulator C-terminal domain-containing protein [Amycolatopsis sp. PS_44_ISF1]|uniref:TetR/AcrR family transcriptional regulator n=1 Tax=Amycolatopsis sp. PS_44_ISF1 TaxID=2974917 RepID=UPI0028DFFF39|nr:TetR family transcriptional regulator C-terminal domain-containing protein [Amycolatopsis sp. PS_44_ISF1]MDT8912993.1 TetR family transcriptional regulator C-terminal domain-containing protein [Amycolatopsis sp. PS_44_ISF1]
MVRASDAAEARERLVGAVVGLVAELGFEAVSVRQVATRAGVSAGTVQYYFPTKQAMLRAAMAEVTARVTTTVRAYHRDLPPEVAVRKTARKIVPLTEAGTEEVRVWLAFTARAAVEEDLAAEHRKTGGLLEAHVADLLARASGRTAAGAGDRANSALLLATLDGLALGAITEPRRLSGRRLARLVDSAVDQALASSRG